MVARRRALSGPEGVLSGREETNARREAGGRFCKCG